MPPAHANRAKFYTGLAGHVSRLAEGTEIKRLTNALEYLRGNLGCERVTGGAHTIGNCYRSGKRDHAEYTSELPCMHCFADRIIKGGSV